MLARCVELSFAKQPIVERCSGVVIGYTGVDWIEFDSDAKHEARRTRLVLRGARGWSDEECVAL
jgi:hypothetical protein